jgi:hypothetical protein
MKNSTEKLDYISSVQAARSKHGTAARQRPRCPNRCCRQWLCLPHTTPALMGMKAMTTAVWATMLGHRLTGGVARLQS